MKIKFLLAIRKSKYPKNWLGMLPDGLCIYSFFSLKIIFTDRSYHESQYPEAAGFTDKCNGLFYWVLSYVPSYEETIACKLVVQDEMDSING